MPAGSGDTLALASRLRTLTESDLLALLRVREVRAGRIADFFDLAEALLDPSSLEQRLRLLDRYSLLVLQRLASEALDIQALEEALRGTEPDLIAGRDAATTVDELDSLALLERENGAARALDGVTAVLGLFGLGDLASAPPPANLAPVDSADQDSTDRLAAETAFETVGAVAELVLELRRVPARELGRGGLALPDARRLAAATGAPQEEIAALHGIAARSALLVREGDGWRAAPDAEGWLDSSPAERWQRLAAAWRDWLPEPVCRLLSARRHATWGTGLQEFVAWLYPAADGALQQRIDETRDTAVRLGLSAQQVPSTPGRVLLADGAEAARERMAELLPASVDRVYLQHDLTVISPGPLRPDLDRKLRELATLEGHGIAASYRIDPGLLSRAFADGRSAGDLLAFLESISLTGIPQPLEYLVNETESRFGSVRVSTLRDDPHGLRSAVRSDDATLLDTIAVDQTLVSLHLMRSGEHRLVSRFERDVVYWSLVDARYPVVAEDDDGRVVGIERERPRPRRLEPDRDPLAELVARLKAADDQAPEQTELAWLSRQLEVAIRAKATLIVTVALPNGTTADYLLEPASVAAGRLRARDRAADIERTLPLKSITAVHPA